MSKRQEKKLQELLRSRRFWTAIIAVLTPILMDLFKFSPEQVQQITQLVMVVAAVYIGGLSLEGIAKPKGGLEIPDGIFDDDPPQNKTE